MGSETMKLPLIDLSNIGEEDSPTLKSTKIQILEALQEYGCFEATFDRVPLHMRESILDGTRQLFDLPLMIKQRHKSEKPYHGYFGPSTSAPLYESMGIDGVLLPGKLDAFTELMWPGGNPSFSKSNIEFFCEKLSNVDGFVRRVVLESFGLEKYVDQHMNSTDYFVRVHKYEAPRSRETTVGVLPHSDKNIVTILHQLNHVRGLQILTKDGKNWMPADLTSPTSFLVMIGASFHAWTNGRLQAPQHRVMMSGDETRYSIGFFSNPKEDCMIRAPEEMVDEEHPLLYKPYHYFKFIDFFLSDAGRASSDALMEYCGA